MDDNIKVSWVIELDVQCPSCGSQISLYDGLDLELGEERNGYNVQCHYCALDFLVDITY